MLPEAAVTFFDHLINQKLSDVWIRLGKEQSLFDRKETNGRGAGYAARLMPIYAEELQQFSIVMVKILKDVHEKFGAPLGTDVQLQVFNIAEKYLSSTVKGLENAFKRHVEPFGIKNIESCLGYQPQLRLAFIKNTLQQYFWTLENMPVPIKTLNQSTIFNFNNSPVNVVQTGANAVANVCHNWTPESVNCAVDALFKFRKLLENTVFLDPSQRVKIVKEIDDVSKEISIESPNTDSVSHWLNNIGMTVQTVAALQPAWQVVKTTLRTLGISY